MIQKHKSKLQVIQKTIEFCCRNKYSCLMTLEPCISRALFVVRFFSLQKYVFNLIKDLAQELGWKEASTDPHLTR